MEPVAVLWFLAGLTLRTVLVAAAAGVALAASRTHSAAFRHAVWTAVAAGMMGIALLYPVLPPVALPLLPARTVERPAPMVSRIPTPPPAPMDSLMAAVPESAPPVNAASPAPPWRRVRAVDALCMLYAAGALLLLGRLLFAYLFARRLVRAAVRAELPPAALALAPLAGTRRVEVLESRWIAVPLTVGFLRPAVLLPAEWPQWPEGKLRSVLAHEFTHVRRRDWLVTLMAGINRAVFWFHPLAWWLERRLAVLAEQACDDAALAACGDPAGYARAVLDMAEAVRSGQGRITWEAMAMAKPSLVGRRIDRILDDTRPVSQAVARWRWPATLACALPLVCGAAVLRLAPVEALPAAVLRPAAPAAVVPPPAPLLARAASAPALAQAAQPAVSAEVRAFVPTLFPLQRVEPVYPEEARGQDWLDYVEVLVTIDPQGRTSKAEPLTGPAPLRSAAGTAVARWLWRPVLREGQPVYAMTQTVVHFRPPGGPAAVPRRPPTQAELGEMSEAGHRTHQLRQAFPRSPAQVLADLEQDSAAATGMARMARLPALAKAAANAAAWEKAESYATELLQAGPGGWNYGNAVHDGNMVLGRVALHRGDIVSARERLLAAGRTTGSPQLNSFGPNMTLAKELIERNERQAVLDYFSLCREFLKGRGDKLDAWSAMVRGGGMPDFGANLVY